ncbi:MAG: hypothetical protein AB7S80_02480 [Rhizobiaceae bacterium]
MRSWPRNAALCLAVLVASCGDPPTEADRAELIGTWNPEDASGRPIEFKADGVFDYRYDPVTVLRLDWKLERKGRVSLTSANGVTLTCYYAVEGNALSIDDGSGKTCVSPGITPPSPMPTKFSRAS